MTTLPFATFVTLIAALMVIVVIGCALSSTFTRIAASTMAVIFAVLTILAAAGIIVNAWHVMRWDHAKIASIYTVLGLFLTGLCAFMAVGFWQFGQDEKNKSLGQ